MKQSINAKGLYDLLYRRLSDMKYIKCMYIGKTGNLEERRKEHEKEGYSHTEAIAEGESDVVNDTEIYLIQEFKKSDLKCTNTNDGGGGNSNATILYVSYLYDKSQMKSIDELDDDELNWPMIYNLN